MRNTIEAICIKVPSLYAGPHGDYIIDFKYMLYFLRSNFYAVIQSPEFGGSMISAIHLSYVLLYLHSIP